MELKILNLMQTLCSELRAIQFWNTAYRHNQAPQEYEGAAFRAREKRRKEIIRELAALGSQALASQKRTKRGRSYIGPV
ncbi:MAG: hypothetical protein WAN17_12520 [Candidatus Sulfotelmatobacter sp.]